MSNLDVLTVGDVCIDYFMHLDGQGLSTDQNNKNPKVCFYHGTKLLVDNISFNPAGNALNVASGVSLLGLKAGIYSEMGNDSFSDEILNEMKKRNISTSYIRRNKNLKTSLNPVMVFGGERTVFSHHPKREYKLENWRNIKWVYYTSLSEGFEALQHYMVNFFDQNANIGLIYNPGSVQMRKGIEFMSHILKKTDILIVNEMEAQMIAGNKTGKELHKELSAFGPKMTVITYGHEGAECMAGNDFTKVKAFETKKKIMDKTGAGDAFSAAFVSAIIYGKSIKEALLWGVINGASVITEVGSLNGILTKDEIERIVKKI